MAKTGDESRDDVFVQLYHNHFPKLSNAGVADYDANRGELTVTKRATPLFDCIEVVDTE